MLQDNAMKTVIFTLQSQYNPKTNKYKLTQATTSSNESLNSFDTMDGKHNK